MEEIRNVLEAEAEPIAKYVKICVTINVHANSHNSPKTMMQIHMMTQTLRTV